MFAVCFPLLTARFSYARCLLFAVVHCSLVVVCSSCFPSFNLSPLCACVCVQRNCAHCRAGRDAAGHENFQLGSREAVQRSQEHPRHGQVQNNCGVNTLFLACFFFVVVCFRFIVVCCLLFIVAGALSQQSTLKHAVLYGRSLCVRCLFSIDEDQVKRNAPLHLCLFLLCCCPASMQHACVCSTCFINSAN